MIHQHCSTCGFHISRHSKDGNRCPHWNIYAFITDGYHPIAQYTSHTDKPVHFIKRAGKWHANIRKGTPQWQRQLARQHLDTLNQEKK